MDEPGAPAETPFPAPPSPPPDVTPLPDAPPSDAADEAADSTLHPFWRILIYAIAIVIGGFFGMMLTMFPYTILQALDTGTPADKVLSGDTIPADYLIVIMLGAYYIVTPLTLLFARYVDQRSLRSLGFTRSGWGASLLKGIALGVGFILVMFGAYAAFGWADFTPVAVQWDLFLLATFLFYPGIGITEEVVFRGYLLKNLEEWKGRAFALVVSTILFWLIHLDQGNAATAMGASAFLAVGGAFALFRYSTGSLWFSIGLHAAYDWAAISLGGSLPDLELPSFARIEVQAPHWLVGPPGHTGIADVAFAFLLLGIAVVAYRGSQERPSPLPTPNSPIS